MLTFIFCLAFTVALCILGGYLRYRLILKPKQFTAEELQAFRDKFWLGILNGVHSHKMLSGYFKEDLIPDFAGTKFYQKMVDIYEATFKQGYKLSEAMTAVGIFSDFEISAVTYGETMGTLDEVAWQISTYLFPGRRSPYTFEEVVKFNKSFWPEFQKAMEAETGDYFKDELIPKFAGTIFHDLLLAMDQHVKNGELWSEAMKTSGLFRDFEIAGVYYGHHMGTTDLIVRDIVNIFYSASTET